MPGMHEEACTAFTRLPSLNTYSLPEYRSTAVHENGILRPSNVASPMYLRKSFCNFLLRSRERRVNGRASISTMSSAFKPSSASRTASVDMPVA